MFVRHGQRLTKIGTRDSAGFSERHGAVDVKFDDCLRRSTGAHASVNVSGFMVSRDDHEAPTAALIERHDYKPI
jgi:hypothetical protein